jgi:hypothetical protein
MSDQTPEQTENDEQSTPTSADEYGSLTVENNPDGTVDPTDLAGTAEESDDEMSTSRSTPSRTSRAEPLLDLSARLVALRAPLAVRVPVASSAASEVTWRSVRSDIEARVGGDYQRTLLLTSGR